MTQNKIPATRHEGAVRLTAFVLALLAASAAMPGAAATAENGTLSSAQTTAQRGQALAESLQEELARRRKDPRGLGMGNGPGVGVSDAFAATMPKGMPEQEVVRTLQAAGFKVLPPTGPKDERLMDASKKMESSTYTETWTMAVIRLHAVDGKQRLVDVNASLTWFAP